MSETAGAIALHPEIFTYNRLSVGERTGTTRLTIDDAMLDAWEGLYGYRPVGGPLPLAFAPVLVMRAFLAVVSPRPPGNLHVGQTYQVWRMPSLHQSMVASVSCSAKELRMTRRVISFTVDLTEGDDGIPLLSGTSTMFWAA